MVCNGLTLNWISRGCTGMPECDAMERQLLSLQKTDEGGFHQVTPRPYNGQCLVVQLCRAHSRHIVHMKSTYVQNDGMAGTCGSPPTVTPLPSVCPLMQKPVPSTKWADASQNSDTSTKRRTVISTPDGRPVTCRGSKSHQKGVQIRCPQREWLMHS